MAQTDPDWGKTALHQTGEEDQGNDLMIIRRYGNRFHSVTIDFDPAAMTEVGFRRDGAWEQDAEEFLAQYDMIREEALMAEATDVVQEAAERIMLNSLREKVKGLVEGLEEGQFLSVESKTGVDYPRTRYDRPTMGDRAFTYTLDQPLRVGIWGKKP
jgi:hypothetical protein